MMNSLYRLALSFVVLTRFAVLKIKEIPYEVREFYSGLFLFVFLLACLAVFS